MVILWQYLVVPWLFASSIGRIPNALGFVPSTRPFKVTYRRHLQDRTRTILSNPLDTTTAATTRIVVAMIPSGAAAGTLILSSGIGFVMERKIIPNSGILTTLMVAAVTSNTFASYIPRQHFLYDICWSYVLPASVALLLLSLQRNPDVNTAGDEGSTASTASNVLSTSSTSTSASIRRLAIPFAIASLGSVLGCCLSFFICYKFPSIWLSPLIASQAAACLTASYIGGSVNFLATASTILLLDNGTTTASSISTMISAMAAVDIVVMALYFVLLNAMLSSRKLQQLFQSNNNIVAPTNLVSFVPELPVVDQHFSNRRSIRDAPNSIMKIMASVLIVLLALSMVSFSQRLEQFLDAFVPGTGCAILAVTIPLLTRNIPPDVSRTALWKYMQSMADSFSTYAFLLLFAAIGVTADIRAVAMNGPACFFFTSTALVVHGVVTIGGSYLYHKIRRKWNNGIQYKNAIRLSDVLIASNAAIGGSATAASFCRQVPFLSCTEKQGLTVAATVWGVVGYAMGTTVGVSLFRLLQAIFFH